MFVQDHRIGQKSISKDADIVVKIDITKGDGKLAWKWNLQQDGNALDIRFEAYGKDIMDSVRVNDWVCE